MALSQPPHSIETYPAAPLVFRLSALSAYSTWGELLTGIHKHNNLTQHKIAEASEVYFKKAEVPILNQRIYGDMERGRRAPYFKELEPLFRTFVEVYGVEFSDLEITAYVHLAKERMAQKSKRIERVDDRQWETLTETLFRINNSKRSQKIHLIKDEPGLAASHTITENPESRRLKAIEQALRTDTSHLLEREEWVTKMLAYPEATPQRKLVVVQGHMGTGKSHALALLTQRLATQSQYYLIPYLFEAGSSKTPEDHLEVFLATIVSDLAQTTPSDEMKQRPLEERIGQVLAVLKERGEQGQKVILLLDDAQVIFPSVMEWSPAWAAFFEALVREPHTTTLYMMTRTWPGWEDRRFAYIEETELPELSVTASVTIWRRSGFDDVPEDLLEKLSRRYGWNPQLIEMSISQCKRRSFTFAWSNGGGVSSREKKNPNTQRLEDLLAQDTIFDPRMDVKARTVLQHSLTSRLSHQAVQMLECLALSPLGLPFPLLVEEFARAEEAFNELASASAIDLNAAAAHRAAIVPLIREAQWQSLLNDGRKESIDQRVTDLYAYWLSTLQDFRDDSEKAGLIAEMVVRYIRQRHLLKAAELFIGYGWLCALFGHIARIQRVYDEVVKEDRGKEIDAAYEVGRLLLRYHIATCSGQEISVAESDRIYQELYTKVIAGNIALEPHTAVNVLHNIVLKYLDSSLFQEANQMFDESFIHHAGLDIPEVHASYLHSKSRLYARWCEHEKRNGNNDNAQRLLYTCVITLRDCIAQWQLCLKNALPLEEHYYNFRLARALNDYAYRQRLSGDLVRAQEAIEESVRLKKASAALPQSLAVSLSEYSQILTIRGKNRLAENFNGEAVRLMKHTIEENGNTALNPELGMLLKERADIYMQQARLDEALPLLELAVELIGEKKSRQSFREKAERQIEEIRFIVATAGDYKLDKRWFARFHDLALYDDLAWLAHAGPFSEDEQDEWNRLYPRREEEEIADRLDGLIVQSRQREFARSQEEHRAPNLWYPHIPLDEIGQRVAGFEQLRKDIELQEPNAIARQLYLEKIDEEITTLRRCEATALQDQGTVWECDLALYGKPTEYEMTIALQPFCTMLLRAKQHEQAGPVAQELLTQLQSWNISPQEIASTLPLVPRQEPPVSKVQSREKHTFPHKVVQRFFQDVFDKEYTSEWQVEIAPARDDPYVDINSRTVFLPPGSYSLDRIRELLAEEIETHAYRAMSGQRSPLALLGLGLAQYGPAEEGLANHRIQQMSIQIHSKSKNKSWMGTLRAGLASGVMTPVLSFLELSAFFEKAFLANLLSRESTGTRDELLAEAKEEAWIQAARAFRGVPNLHEAGCCSLKDRIYLQGYLDVIRFLETRNEECLYVGKIGIQHVDTLAELHILKPYYPQRNLALSRDLLERLCQYK